MLSRIVNNNINLVYMNKKDANNLEASKFRMATIQHDCFKPSDTKVGILIFK